MTSDELRLVWTTIGAVGVLAGCAATAYVWWLHRSVGRDLWALSQVMRPTVTLMMMTAKSDQRDIRLLGAAVVTWTLVLMIQTAAGLTAYIGFTMYAIALLVASEALGVVGLAIMFVLGLLKHRSRIEIRNAVRLARAEQ